MIIYEVKGENDEGNRWTERCFQDKEKAEELLKELEAEDLPYVEFWIESVVVD